MGRYARKFNKLSKIFIKGMVKKHRRKEKDDFELRPTSFAKTIDFIGFWSFLPLVLWSFIPKYGLLIFLGILIYRYMKNRQIAYKRRLNLINSDIEKISPRKFEFFVADLFKELGFDNVKVTPPSGDHGKDVVAFKGKDKIVIECKKYKASNLIGEPMLRSFLGTIHAENAAKGFFVTTSDFTQPAYKFAQEQDIKLINREKLLALVDRCKKEKPQSTVDENYQPMENI